MNTTASFNQLLPERFLGGFASHQYQPGDFIYVAGPDSKVLYFIDSGYVRLGTYRRSGTETLHGIVVPGGMLGDLSGSPTVSDEFAQALTPVRAYMVRRDQFLQQATQTPALLDYVLQQLHRRLQHVETHLTLSLTGDAYSRVARCIQYLGDLCGQRFGDRVHLENLFTQSDIAQMVGVSRQCVSTILTEMKQHGYIDYKRRRLRLTPSFNRFVATLN
jgi:CRP/FNR family transcriptional regulator, cyclic AMP receptor protein